MEPSPPPPTPAGCRNCHQISIDAAHDLGCTACHSGQDNTADLSLAHADLLAQPAHPDHMTGTCGSCHEKHVVNVAESAHFTLRNKVNLVRHAFGAEEEVRSLLDIPEREFFTTPLALADDLLRRRCLRCHPYSKGDTYPETVRGTGCAACHLDYAGGTLKSHAFVRKPDDRQCLHCHYGNVVGADYHGRFEHDFSWEFRTPYRTDNVFSRPYGVEYHEFIPDVHQQAGMTCIDCHSGYEMMNSHARGEYSWNTPTASCSGCHKWTPDNPLQAEVRFENGALLLETSRGTTLTVPQALHPAHQLHADTAECTVCHAQWTFTDQGTHLLRQDTDNYDLWTMLSVQGSFHIETLIETGIFGDTDEEMLPAMADIFSGLPKEGFWLKGYEQRRWEFPLIGMDTDRRLKVFRPVLDLYLSHLDAEDRAVFDSVKAQTEKDGLRPYTPHTIGKAGAFYPLRLKDNLAEYRAWQKQRTEQ